MVGGNMFDMRPALTIVAALFLVLGFGLGRCQCGYEVHISVSHKDGGQ